jgi:hypothetical protein
MLVNYESNKIYNFGPRNVLQSKFDKFSKMHLDVKENISRVFLLAVSYHLKVENAQSKQADNTNNEISLKLHLHWRRALANASATWSVTVASAQ